MEFNSLVSYASEECSPDKEVTFCYAPYFMLHFIKSGCGYFNGRKLSAGEGFFVQWGKWIEYYPDKDDPWSYAWINFKDSEILKEITSTIEWDNDGVFKYDVSFPYYETLRDMHDMKWHHHRIVSPYDEAHLCASVFHIIMSYLYADKCCRKEVKHISHRENHVRECERIIENSYHRQDLTVNKIADKLHLSRAYLRNLFVEYKGMPPQKYLLDFRMKRAAEFLEATDMPIGIIANSVGYSDQFQFSKLFKKYYAMSPKAYRNKMQED